MKNIQGRGHLSPEISKKLEDFFGRPSSVEELRLIPYVQYVMANSQCLDVNKISPKEREILSQWRQAGHITGGASGMTITRRFWDFACDVIFVAYVASQGGELEVSQ